MLTQEKRIKVYESFKETNGEEVAMALAEGFEDIATKDDLKNEIGLLRTELKGDIKTLDGKIEKLEGKVDVQFRWLVGFIVTVLVAVVGSGFFG